jgi:hypothetical protein
MFLTVAISQDMEFFPLSGQKNYSEAEERKSLQKGRERGARRETRRFHNSNRVRLSGRFTRIRNVFFLHPPEDSRKNSSTKGSTCDREKQGASAWHAEAERKVINGS